MSTIKQNIVCSFNQDASCLAVAGEKGYSLFNCTDPFGRFYQSSTADAHYRIVSMLFSTRYKSHSLTKYASLVALVSSNTSLQIYNTKRKSTICLLEYDAPLLAVLLNKQRLVALLEEKIILYDMSNMKVLV